MTVILDSVDKLEQLGQIIRSFPTEAEIAVPLDLNGLGELCSFLDAFSSTVRPCSYWFKNGRNVNDGVAATLDALSEQITKIDNIRNKILSKWDKGVFEIDHSALLIKFRTSYSSVFRTLNKDYKADTAMLKALYKGSEKCRHELLKRNKHVLISDGKIVWKES